MYMLAGNGGRCVRPLFVLGVLFLICLPVTLMIVDVSNAAAVAVAASWEGPHPCVRTVSIFRCHLAGQRPPCFPSRTAHASC